MKTYHLLVDWCEPDPQKKHIYTRPSYIHRRSVDEKGITLDQAIEIIKEELIQETQQPDRSFQITLTPVTKGELLDEKIRTQHI